MDETPFDEITIKRGARVDDDKMFSKVFGRKKENDVHESEVICHPSKHSINLLDTDRGILQSNDQCLFRRGKETNR